MPELPEIASRAKEIKQLLVGKKIQGVEILATKMLEYPPRGIQSNLINSTILDSTHRGKWIQVKTHFRLVIDQPGYGWRSACLQIALTFLRNTVLIFDFSDDSCLTINFWWFGYVHFCTPEGILQHHDDLQSLDPNVLDLSEAEFTDLL